MQVENRDGEGAISGRLEARAREVHGAYYRGGWRAPEADSRARAAAACSTVWYGA